MTTAAVPPALMRTPARDLVTIQLIHPRLWPSSEVICTDSMLSRGISRDHRGATSDTVVPSTVIRTVQPHAAHPMRASVTKAAIMVGGVQWK